MVNSDIQRLLSLDDRKSLAPGIIVQRERNGRAIMNAIYNPKTRSVTYKMMAGIRWEDRRP